MIASPQTDEDWLKQREAAAAEALAAWQRLERAVEHGEAPPWVLAAAAALERASLAYGEARHALERKLVSNAGMPVTRVVARRRKEPALPPFPAAAGTGTSTS